MLSNRLKSITKYINKDDTILDVGCDHGLLAIYLVLEKQIKNITISDISKSAIKSAELNIQKHNLEKYINVVVADGFKNIDSKINTLTISGLGGVNIKKILKAGNLENINKIIIQANNNHYFIRKYLINNNYIITHEEVLFEKKHYYINICFEKGKNNYSKLDLIYGPILRKNNHDYINLLYKKEKEIYNDIPLSQFKNKIKKLLTLLEIKYILLIK